MPYHYYEVIGRRKPKELSEKLTLKKKEADEDRVEINASQNDVTMIPK